MNILFFLSIFIFVLYIMIKTKKALHILQQNLYNLDNRYLFWLKKNIKTAFFNKDIYIFIIIPIMFFIPYIYSIIIFILFFSILFIYEFKKEIHTTYKKPLVITSRLKRLIITTILVNLLPIIIIIFNNTLYNYIFLILFLILEYIVVLTANIINIPIEKIVYNHFMRLAKNKLKNMPNLKIIGITGSYGKTSSKNILNDILSFKFNSLKSPANFNTPQGLMITINNHLTKFDDILIAEMGAYKKGDIKELCDFVHPKYAIITKIGTSHLESFGSFENIQEGKFELIETLPSDGIAILNKDDDMQVAYVNKKLKNKCKIIWIGIKDTSSDIIAKDIKYSNIGTTFNIKFKEDKKTYQFHTKLLGEANIYNILASIALSREFGSNIEEMIKGVNSVRSIEHRLELQRHGNLTVIDDTYSSNPVGAKMALDVLKLMPGKKIIVTPGMVEMGVEQYELNKEFGRQISVVCDKVVLVGERQSKPILEGLIEKNYNKNNIIVKNKFKEAFDYAMANQGENTFILLENDLPDIYNE